MVQSLLFGMITIDSSFFVSFFVSMYFLTYYKKVTFTMVVKQA